MADKEKIEGEIGEQVNTFLQNEALSVGRYFGRFSTELYGEKATYAFLGLYMYVRYLDDLVDGEGEANSNRNILIGEISGLLNSENASDITSQNPGYVVVENPNEYTNDSGFTPISKDQFTQIDYIKKLLQWGLLNTDPEIYPSLKQYLIEGLRGFYLENEYNSIEKPIPDMFRGYRNHRALTVYFQIASLVLWGRELGNEDTVNRFNTFIDWAVKADILNDLYDDLANGVIPFDTELMDKFNMKLVKGEKIPKEMQDLWKSIKKDVVANSVTCLKESMAPDFPLYTKVLFLMYFIFKFQKILYSTPPTSERIFCENK